MTAPTKENEHIRGAVELVRAKAKNRLARLQIRVESGDIAPALNAEIEEVERIVRLADSAWQDLDRHDGAEAPAQG